MILIIVGTHNMQFNRLIKEMDKISSKIEEEVVMQIGYSTYMPKHANYFRFLDEEKFTELFKQSRIIVTHGGIGTIIRGIKEKKPLIIVPRLKKYGEHYDDHQIEIANYLVKKNYFVVYNVDDLLPMIKQIYFQNETNIDNKKNLIHFIKKYLITLSKKE